MSAARIALGALAGLSLALAMPPYGVCALGAATFALLAASLRRARPRDALLAWWAAGFVAFVATGPWLVETLARFTGTPSPLGALALLGASAWMSAALGLAGYFAASLRHPLGAPLACGASVWASLRYGPRIFPYPLALPLIDVPGLPQCADLVGVEGLGALLTALSLSLIDGLATRRWRPVALSLAALTACFVYGAVRGAQVAAHRGGSPEISVALVQPGVGASLRWREDARRAVHARLVEVTRLGASGAALTVWHESAYPYELSMSGGFDGVDAPAVLPGWSGALLFGAMARARSFPSERFNAVLIRRADGSLSRPVAKRYLLPFGEYLPVVAWSARLHAWVTGGTGLSRGSSAQRISLEHSEIGVLNCFEDTIPEAGAPLAGVDLLVNVTNDAWFDASNNEQHVLASRWRAIELRRDLVRASNMGRSAHIDAAGRVLALAPQGEIAVLRVEARRIRGMRSAAPSVIVWGPRLALALLIAAWWRRRAAGVDSR